MVWIREKEDGVLFKIVVQPRGSQNQIVGLHGDAIKVRLTAPPVEGAANAMCVAFLAKLLTVPKSAVKIVRGHRNRSKTVWARSKTAEDVKNLLDR